MKEKLSNFIKNTFDELKFKRISFDKIQVKSDHILIHISGGGNGPGRWQDYLGQIDSIVRAFKGSYVVDIINDCPDDIWYLRLGLRMTDKLMALLPIDVAEFAKANPGQWAIKVGDDDDYIYCDNGKTFCYDEDATIKRIQNIGVGQAINFKTGGVVTCYSETETLCDSLSMKTSCELFELGIPHEWATTHCIYEAPYRTAGIGFCPVFSLGDLLRILPPFITMRIDNNEVTRVGLVIQTVGKSNKLEYNVSYRTIPTIGVKTEYMVINRQCSQLTEALAALIKWCISDGHIVIPSQKITLTTSATVQIDGDGTDSEERKQGRAK